MGIFKYLSLGLLVFLSLPSGLTRPAFADADAGSCDLGNLGEDVIREIQRSLTKRGYPCGTADGKAGGMTRFAFEKYREEKHLDRYSALRALLEANKTGVDVNYQDLCP